MQEKMQKEFINIAAHELKTPIMPIMAVSEMIESKLRSEKKKIILDSRQAQIVIRNAKRLEQLSQDILDITRIESNTLRLRKQMVNIKEIIYALLQDFGNQLIERNIKINRKHVEDIFVEADKGRLNQVIANLLNNAIKFTENGVITITARKQNSSSSSQHTNKRLAIVSIKDTGYGIDQEVLTKLFSKFATKSEKGMGLGLYISKNIIEAHGGRIWAENNIDGKGATLTFTIPIRSQQNELGNNDKSSIEEVAPAAEAD
jgi:signal transduction histidine kinase